MRFISLAHVYLANLSDLSHISIYTMLIAARDITNIINNALPYLVYFAPTDVYMRQKHRPLTKNRTNFWTQKCIRLFYWVYWETVKVYFMVAYNYLTWKRKWLANVSPFFYVFTIESRNRMNACIIGFVSMEIIFEGVVIWNSL